MGRIDWETETFVAHSVVFDSKGTQVQTSEGATPTLRSMGHDKSHQNAGGQLAVAFRTTGNDGCYETGDVVGALNTATDPNQQVVAFDLRGREGGAQFEGPHDTANIRASNGGSSRSYVQQAWAVRRLTPLECLRLQGFPDDYFDKARLNKPLADGPKYKMLGNSMAVNVMSWIGQRIQMEDMLS